MLLWDHISSEQDMRSKWFVLGGGQDELYSNKHIAICKDCRGHCFVLHKRNQSEGEYPMTKELSGRSEQFRPPLFLSVKLGRRDIICKISMNIPPYVALAEKHITLFLPMPALLFELLYVLTSFCGKLRFYWKIKEKRKVGVPLGVALQSLIFRRL